MAILTLFFVIFLLSVINVTSWISSGRAFGQFIGKLRPLSMATNYNLDHFKKMIERKKVDVQNLLRRHQDPSDPLMMRLTYMSDRCKYNMTHALKIPAEPGTGMHKMSVMIDMKRTSPTFPDKKNVVDFTNAGRFAELLTMAKADSFLINTDDVEYGGKFEELKECTKAVKNAYKGNRSPPACIRKDLIIHPIQIAQAVESGAQGVLLIAGVVGADLEELLNACTIMGTEALVEVHTPNELEYALKCQATCFLVNLWDRFSGKLYPNQAHLIDLMPINAVAMIAGNIASMKQIYELGNYGYDGIVLGRNIAEVPDLKEFIDGVHAYRGLPRGPDYGMGMKGNLVYTMQASHGTI